jgi:hypothetical protein
LLGLLNGGLEMGAELVLGPLEHVWHAEFDAAPSAVLEARWPGVPNLGDIAAVTAGTSEPRSTCSAPATRARANPTPDSDEVKMTPDSAGPTYGRPFARYDPALRIWRTSRGISTAASPESSPTFPPSGMCAGGSAYELPTLERPTSGSASSSLPGPKRRPLLGCEELTFPLFWTA